MRSIIISQAGQCFARQDYCKSLYIFVCVCLPNNIKLIAISSEQHCSLVGSYSPILSSLSSAFESAVLRHWFCLHLISCSGVVLLFSSHYEQPAKNKRWLRFVFSLEINMPNKYTFKLYQTLHCTLKRSSYHNKHAVFPPREFISLRYTS